MAMDPSGAPLATQITDALVALNPRITGAARTQLIDYWTVICAQIITYVQQNADVLPAAHTGENLSSPTGQSVLIPSTSSVGDPSSGATDADKELVGMGSVA
jgi:hypothetical protein